MVNFYIDLLTEKTQKGRRRREWAIKRMSFSVRTSIGDRYVYSLSSLSLYLGTLPLYFLFKASLSFECQTAITDEPNCKKPEPRNKILEHIFSSLERFHIVYSTNRVLQFLSLKDFEFVNVRGFFHSHNIGTYEDRFNLTFKITNCFY